VTLLQEDLNQFEHKELLMKPLCVCTTCRKDFTRRFNAYRHNENNHSDTAEILPLFEYVVQRYC
jgi:hypothetical protein